MKAVLLKEIKSFFGSPIGYLVIGVFLLINALFLFVFEGDYNILNSGFADMSSFFTIAPWIFVFLIPAVTMRTISEERRQGTLELLVTKPLTSLEIVLGKFFGCILLIAIAVLPTLIYVKTISYFAMPVGNIDLGSIVGSYIGLLFLIFAYTAIGVFSSSVSENQIVAFIIAAVLCFAIYFGFSGISAYAGIFGENIASLGMDFHFKSMARGVIDTRDVVYFISVATLFLASTTFRLKTLTSR